MFNSVKRSIVQTDNAEMEYAVFGKGERAFVIIPGLSIKSVIESAGQVARAYSRFAKTHTVYLFDRRKKIEKGITLDDMADDIIKSMKALGISDADVFGASQGGMIAQLVAAREPQLVHRLIIASSAAKTNEYAEKVVGGWIKTAMEKDAVALSKSFAQRLYSESFNKKFGKIIVKMTSDCTEEELERFVNLALACEGLDITSETKKISCPTLVIGAKEDMVLTCEPSEEIARLLNCELYLYPAPYSHAVYDEAPDYKDRIAAFFNG